MIPRNRNTERIIERILGGGGWIEGAREVDIGLTTTPMNCQACEHPPHLDERAGLCPVCIKGDGPCYLLELR